jgi:hypothetical protein
LTGFSFLTGLSTALGIGAFLYGLFIGDSNFCVFVGFYSLCWGAATASAYYIGRHNTGEVDEEELRIRRNLTKAPKRKKISKRYYGYYK